jgi:hypothetical protein
MGSCFRKSSGTGTSNSASGSCHEGTLSIKSEGGCSGQSLFARVRHVVRILQLAGVSPLLPGKTIRVR